MSFDFKYRDFAEALYYALKEDAFYIAMEDSIENRNSSKEAMLRYMEFSMLEAGKYGELYIPEDHSYGVSIWAKPISEELMARRNNDKKLFLLKTMGEKCLNTYNTIVDFMSTQAEPYIEEDFWYLSIVGILPEFQGQGLGPELLKSVLRKTDTINTPTYLETFTPRNMTFYKRLGYQEIASFQEPTTKALYYLMIREPSAI